MNNLHPRERARSFETAVQSNARDWTRNVRFHIRRMATSLIIYDILHVTKILGPPSTQLHPTRSCDQFDLACDLVSLKDVKTGVDLIRLRKSLLFGNDPDDDSLAHGTWRDPKTNAIPLRCKGRSQHRKNVARAAGKKARSSIGNDGVGPQAAHRWGLIRTSTRLFAHRGHRRTVCCGERARTLIACSSPAVQ